MQCANGSTLQWRTVSDTKSAFITPLSTPPAPPAFLKELGLHQGTSDFILKSMFFFIK